MDDTEKTRKPSRKEFMEILWERYADPSTAHHGSTLRYAAMIAEYNGWNKPDAFDGDMIVNIRIGECQECKAAGRETSHERRERQQNSPPAGAVPLLGMG